MRKLTFQLVPQTAWYSNLRSLLPNWSEISNKVREKQVCEICGKRTNQLDAHEVWKYANNNQLLDKILAVCKDCHLSIHIGFANTQGKSQQALEHYAKVNNLTAQEVEEDLSNAYDVWMKRSQLQWNINQQQIKQKVFEQLHITCDIEQPVNGRWYTKVAYSQKEQAKSMGAKWDYQKKMWYFTSEQQRNQWNEQNPQ